MSKPHLPLPGPILFARGHDEAGARFCVVTTTAEDAAAPEFDVPLGRASAPEQYYARFGAAVWGAELTLPVHPDAAYWLDGRRHPVQTELDGDCRLAFLSCNGQEKGEEGWDEEHRGLMWRRLLAEHEASPLALLLQGGDQLYADQVKFCHPEIARWAKMRPGKRDDVEMTREMADTAERWLFHRYLALHALPSAARLHAEVPSVMIWDDHDIFDGWGSHPAPVQESAVGQGLFRAACRMFRMFQMGEPPAARPPPQGFLQTLRMPGFSVVVPDLRSTRTPRRIMSEDAWQAFEAALDGLPPGEPLVLLSSVPALGPRLSWLEAAMKVIPHAQRYEDDLRDQWQSRWHRDEWRRLLTLLEREVDARGRPVVIVSGEIHLATRGQMRTKGGGCLHQLVASGIAHPAPSAGWGRALGLLARFGESPLRGRPISLHPLPGRRTIYTRERNYLLLIRESDRWHGVWETEDGGPSGALDLTAA